MNELQVLDERQVFDKAFTVYGTYEKPLFLAKDVAEWIDYAWKDAKHDHRDVSKMIASVDEDEKILIKGNSLPLCLANGRGARQYWFLTEDGFYEVCMTSRKPIAKKWRKCVKQILHEIRVNGMYVNEVKSPVAALEMLGQSINALKYMFIDVSTRLETLEGKRKTEYVIADDNSVKEIEFPQENKSKRKSHGVNATTMAEMLGIGKGKAAAREFNQCMIRAGVIRRVLKTGYRFTTSELNDELGIEYTNKRINPTSAYIYWFPERVMNMFEYKNYELVRKA